MVDRLLRWMRNYYIGKNVKNAEEIRTKLNQGTVLPGIFLITFSKHPDHLLEIIPAVMLLQKWNERSCRKVVGVAKGKKEAMELVADIFREVYDNTGTVDIKKYLKNR